MNLDDAIREKLAKFTSWFQVVDYNNTNTIEDFSFRDGVPKEGVAGHCQKCITINKCYFKDEKNKKPEEFDYSNRLVLPMFRGLYHPFCECIKLGQSHIQEKDIEIILTNDKMDYLYKDKQGLIEAWGYKEEDKEELKQIIINQAKSCYAKGNYLIRLHDKYGVHITVFLEIPGKRTKLGKFYKRMSGFMIYPNKKLKNITPIGGIYK